jgi:hypothetical protein
VAQGLVRYRCFLPDLTGFTAPPCTGPNYQQSTSQSFAGYKSQALRTHYRILASRNGGEGGIRTPGTLIRGTHDFQSCTFNRSVTSPVCNLNGYAICSAFSTADVSKMSPGALLRGVFCSVRKNLTRSKTNYHLRKALRTGQRPAFFLKPVLRKKSTARYCARLIIVGQKLFNLDFSPWKCLLDVFKPEVRRSERNLTLCQFVNAVKLAHSEVCPTLYALARRGSVLFRRMDARKEVPDSLTLL